jgi:drug/metabolite transporter (DMT)-like permease
MTSSRSQRSHPDDHSRVTEGRVSSGSVAGFGYAAVATVGFGFGGIFAVLAYEHGGDVSAAIAVRGAAFLPLLLVLASATRRARARRAWRQLVPMGLLMVSNAVTFFVAVSRMSPALVTLIIYAYPAIVAVGSRLLGWSVLNSFTALVVGLTSLGVGLTIGLPGGAADPLAVGLCVVNAFGYSSYLLLAQAALRRADPLTTYAVAAGVSSLFVLPGAFVFGEVTMPVDGTGIASIVALTVLSTLLPSVVQLFGIRRLGTAATALVNCLEIVTVVAASAAILGEPVRGAAIAGGVLVILGALAAPVAARQRERPPAAVAARAAAR